MRSSTDSPATVLASGGADPGPRPLELPSWPVSGSNSSYLDSFRDGHKEGYEVGYQQGLLSSRSKLDRAAGALESAARKFQDATDSAARLAEQLAVELALELCEVILDRELECTNTVGADAIRRALESATPHQSVTVHLNPADAAVADAGGLPGVEVVDDPAILKGCAEIHLGSGIVPLDPHAALDRAREALSS